MEFINPSDAPAPASKYSQGVVVPAGGRRLVISGQIGMTKDGKVLEGMEAQLRQSWQNILAVLRAGGMAVTDLVKITIFVLDPQAVGLSRQIRDEVMQGHQPASTFLVVAGLAMPSLLCEIEAEAVKDAAKDAQAVNRAGRGGDRS
jgi:enamine deaminase RidA (YjgF/YER057c/UK114 family)